MIRRIMDNLIERLDQCVYNNGKYLNDVKFKT